MEIWYKARPTSVQLITKVEVESSTKDFIQIRGERTRTAKKNNWEAYFPTEQEARDYLLNIYKDNIKKAEEHLVNTKTNNERYIQQLENFKL